MKELLVVVPTYNESMNIPILLKRIDLARAELAFDVLIVDDNSPDGTASQVRQLQEEYEWLHLLERPKMMGLGSAYRDGFRWGLDRGYLGLGEMDADLSHDPASVPQLHSALAAGADLALGSRYVRGGACVGWPLRRRALSWSANFFARTVLGLSVHDVTGGFRLYSRRAAWLLVQETSQCDGYGFQVEGVWAVVRSGLNVTEVPITFRDRQLGTSKMSAGTALEAAQRCLKLSVSAAPDIPLGMPLRAVPTATGTGVSDARLVTEASSTPETEIVAAALPATEAQAVHMPAAQDV